MVKVGYSNFNQDCEQNWSDYGSGWELNSENPEYFGCSWPMLRVRSKQEHRVIVILKLYATSPRNT